MLNWGGKETISFSLDIYIKKNKIIKIYRIYQIYLYCPVISTSEVLRRHVESPDVPARTHAQQKIGGWQPWDATLAATCCQRGLTVEKEGTGLDPAPSQRDKQDSTLEL
jgi:hypothetical protein